MQKNEQKSSKNLRNWDFFCTFAARFCYYRKIVCETVPIHSMLYVDERGS